MNAPAPADRFGHSHGVLVTALFLGGVLATSSATAAPLGFDAHLTSATATCAVVGDSTNVAAVGSGMQGACFDTIDMGAETMLSIDRLTSSKVLLEFAVGNKQCNAQLSVAFPSQNFGLCPQLDDPAFGGRDASGAFTFAFDTLVELLFDLNTNPGTWPAGVRVMLNGTSVATQGFYTAVGRDFALLIEVDADADLPVPRSFARSLVADVTITGSTIPEPSTVLLLGTGLGVVAYRRRPARGRK